MIEVWIFDDEDYIQVTAMPWRLSSHNDTTTLSSRGSRATPYFGTYQSDSRPTKAEAKRELEYLTIPFRLGAPFVPPAIKPIFVSAPRLAEFLIDVDPQNRFRD